MESGKGAMYLLQAGGRRPMHHICVQGMRSLDGAEGGGAPATDTRGRARAEQHIHVPARAWRRCVAAGLMLWGVADGMV